MFLIYFNQSIIGFALQTSHFNDKFIKKNNSIIRLDMYNLDNMVRGSLPGAIKS